MKFSSDFLKVRESFIYDVNTNKDIKIVGVGDIHLSKYVKAKDLNNIFHSIKTINPDYICILGDLIDKVNYLKRFENTNNIKEFLYKLSLISPVFLVLGNHDFISKENKEYNIDDNKFWNEINEMNNIYVLDDKTYEDDNIFVGGYTQKLNAYYNKRFSEDSKAFRKDLSSKENLYKDLPMNKTKLFICHSPALIDKNYDLLKDYKVILCGHYHNGMVFNFLDNVFNFGIIDPCKKPFPRYARGIRKIFDSYLVYSGGYTKIQEVAPKVLHIFDKLYNRQMDVINISSNDKYKKVDSSSYKLCLKK